MGHWNDQPRLRKRYPLFFSRIVENLEHISKWRTLFVGVHWCARCWFCGGKLPCLASGRVPASLFSAPLTGEGEAANLIKGMGVSEGGREQAHLPSSRSPSSSLPPARVQIDPSVSGFTWPQMCKMSSAVSSSPFVRSSALALQLDDTSRLTSNMSSSSIATRRSQSCDAQVVLTLRQRYL